ncbi:MAG: LysR substrate-binding domain-containing protein [Terrimicrobiaceae bacterium]
MKLLERSTRGIKLTEAGKFFADEAGAVLARADQALKAVRALARGETGELRVGYAPSPTAEILPRALAAFQTAAPCVRVTLLDLASDDLESALLDGRVHVSVMVKPGSRPQPEVLFEEIVRYALRVAVARHHRFARMRKVPLPRLLGEPLAAYARAEYTEYHEMLDTIFRDSRWETEHCSGMRWRHVAACGSRIGAWCGHSARDLSQPGRLTCETAPDRTDTAPDDRGLCLVGYNNAYCCIPSIPATCTNGGKCFRTGISDN